MERGSEALLSARLAMVAMATLPELHWRVAGSEWERHRVSRREWRG